MWWKTQALSYFAQLEQKGQEQDKTKKELEETKQQLAETAKQLGENTKLTLENAKLMTDNAKLTTEVAKLNAEIVSLKVTPPSSGGEGSSWDCEGSSWDHHTPPLSGGWNGGASWNGGSSWGAASSWENGWSSWDNKGYWDKGYKGNKVQDMADESESASGADSDPAIERRCRKRSMLGWAKHKARDMVRKQQKKDKKDKKECPPQMALQMLVRNELFHAVRGFTAPMLPPPPLLLRQ